MSKREPFDTTLGNFAQQLRAQDYAARTIATYLWHLGHFRRWLADRGLSSFAALSTDHVAAYQRLLASRPGKGGRPLSAGSRAIAASAIRMLGAWLVRAGAARTDPARDLELPRMRKTLPDNVLSVREVERLLGTPALDDPEGLRDRALMELLYATGLRQSEALDLRLDDVDLAGSTVRVRRGKGGAGRMAPLAREAVAALSAYLAEARALLAQFKDSGFFFVSRAGTRLDPSGMLKRFKRYAGAAGIKRPVGFHTFRHSVATHLMQRGVHIRYIMELLGHGSLGATQIYTRVTIDDLKRAHARYHPRERMDV